MILECKNCNADIQIKENVLFFSGEKSLETANCPECEMEVYHALTDGWFYVELKGQNVLQDSTVFPMP